LPHKNLAVETLRKLLNNEIKIRSRKFLIQSRSFAAMLEESIRKYQNRAIEAAAVIEELIAPPSRCAKRPTRRKTRVGGRRSRLYDALETNDSAVKALGDENLRFIARELLKTIRENVTIDWTAKESVRAKLRVMVSGSSANTATRRTSRKKQPRRFWNRRNFCARNGTGKHESGLIHARRR